MRNPSYTTAFKKDVKLAQKRGLKVDALKLVLTLIIEEKQLLDRHKNHKLSH